MQNRGLPMHPRKMRPWMDRTPKRWHHIRCSLQTMPTTISVGINRIRQRSRRFARPFSGKKYQISGKREKWTMEGLPMTRRKITLIFAIGLTMLLGLGVAQSPQNTTTGGAPAGYSAQTTTTQTPRRDAYTQKKMDVRQRAKRWLLQRIHIEEWRCIDEVIWRESRWIPNLWNSQGSNAYGLGQIKGSYDYTKNKPMKQFKVAVRIGIYKHGTLCGMLDHHNKYGWW